MENKNSISKNLYTAFGLRNGLTPLIDSHYLIYENKYGILKFYPDYSNIVSNCSKVSLTTDKGDYDIVIYDNCSYKKYFNSNILDSIVLDDDSLFMAQRGLNNAKMSFVYSDFRPRETINADLCVLKFNSKENSEERSLLTIMQMMCALFGDVDESILDFFIDMANYFFTGNYNKPGIDIKHIVVKDINSVKTCYQKMQVYLQNLYNVQCIS